MKNGYSAIHLGVVIIGVLSQTRAELDTKAHLYLYDERFNDHEQAQLATAEVDLRNKVAAVGCLPDIDIDIDIKEFCSKIKLSIQTKGFNMDAEYKNFGLFFSHFCINKLELSFVNTRANLEHPKIFHFLSLVIFKHPLYLSIKLCIFSK